MRREACVTELLIAWQIVKVTTMTFQRAAQATTRNDSNVTFSQKP
jgi:hypothetical protein